MPSSPSALLKLELQQTGEHLGSWGLVLNAIFSQVEEGMASALALTITGDRTLTSDMYVSNEYRRHALILNGSPSAPPTITVPAVSKGYWIVNRTGQVATIKTASGTGAAVRVGAFSFVLCDGTNCTAADPTLDQVAKPTGPVDMNGQKSINQAAATALTDSATLSNRLDQFALPAADISFGGYRLTVLADGAPGSQMAASVKQVENLINASSSSTFPVQSGHAYEVVTTDGTTPSFSPLGRLRDTHDFFVAGWN